MNSARTEAGQEIVRLDHVVRSFGQHPAVNDVSLSVRQGEVLGVIGRSGAGKSTLIRCLNGLERPDSGKVFFDGEEISALSESELMAVRRRIGMIFQHFNLMSAKTVIDNVALPLKIAGVAKPDRLARAQELLEIVGLADKAQAYPASLSGGQKQRVGIARALAGKPALLLSDEATSALDPETTHSILTLLKKINRDLGLTIVLITHEMEVIRAIADRVAVLDAGRLAEEGDVWKVFAEPKSDAARRMLSEIRPQLPPELAARLAPEPSGEAILQIDAAGEPARSPMLSDFARVSSATSRLIQGGMEHIQGEPIARLFVATPADEAGFAREFFQGRGARVEVLGYVADLY